MARFTLKIVLPNRINADALLPLLARLYMPLAPQEQVELDFSHLIYVTSVGLVTLAATITRWQRSGHPVHTQGLDQCEIAGYLQRMDLFRVCGLNLNETFHRHDPRGRFVPLRIIDHQVDSMGREMAGCLAPGGEEYGHPLCDLYDMAWYVLTEIANNVQQHSRGQGFVSAQVTRNEGMVRMAIADNGRGILRSFQDAGLAWSIPMDDSQAIGKALEPRISSKGGPSNEGVGLTLVGNLVRLIKGCLVIASGTGVARIQWGSPLLLTTLPAHARYNGTLVGMTFRQNDIHDYGALLQQAKAESGLLQDRGSKIRFKP